MDTFLMLVFTAGIIACIVFFVLLIVNAVKKKPVKVQAIGIGASFFIAIVALFTAAILDPSEPKEKVAIETETEKEEVSVDKEKSDEKAEDETTAEAAEEQAQPEQTDDNAYYAQSTQKLSELESIDTALTDLLVEKGYSIEHATAIQEILNTIGIESLEIESMTGEAETGLNSVVSYPNGYTDRDRRFYFTTEDGVLFYAGFLSEDLYDSEKGGYLKNYNDVHVPEKEVTRDDFYKLQELAEPAVKQCLNYPNTANFDGFSYRVGRSDENYQLLGTVSAKNGFGVKDDLPFSVWFIKDDNGFSIVGIAIDGVRVQ